MYFRALRNSGLLLVALVCAVLTAPIARTAMAGSEEHSMPASDKLPPYEFKYSNGLYATIAGYLAIKNVELKSQKKIKLKVENFRQKFPVRVVLQDRAAPLVVVLLGIDGRADGDLGKLWPSWYAAAGYHVLSFDSTFTPAFTELAGRGVTGNLVSESEAIRDIVAAFIEQGGIKDKITKIGVVGMSYGGIEALVLGQMAKEGHLPFAIDAIQAYSPPIKIEATGEMIDRWFREDRWQYTLAELADKLSGHKPVDPNSEVPFPDGLMRAGLAALFRLGLVDVIVRNNEMYKMHILPEGNTFDSEYIKRDYAEVMGYCDFINKLAFPYWQRKANMQQLSDLTGPSEIPTLLAKQPATSQVIIAEDDPFNTPEDLAALKASFAKSPALLMLPRGGHLGYANEAWTKAKLLTLFDKPAQAMAEKQ
ncbi:MAG TPA: hypothetical protein VGP72_29285 [Planctomycetota bacterium]|jgi:predicted alpha/beta-fold hydrolase